MLKKRLVPATIDMFLDNRKFFPFKQWRITAKALNFSLLFGAQAPTFAKALREGGFTEDDADEAVDAFNLRDAYNKMVLEQKQMGEKGKDALTCKYLVCATAFREIFFKTYPGLMTRIEREREHAKKYGFTQSWHGAVRHLPELKFMKYNSKGNLVGADKKLYSKMCANLLNVTANSPIQTLEAYHAFVLWAVVMQNLKKWKFKSRIWNGTHDSIDMWLYVPEKDVVLALVQKIVSIVKTPHYEIPLHMDASIADVSTPELLKNNYYKGGDEVSLDKYDGKLDELLAEWNSVNGTELKFVDTIPR